MFAHDLKDARLIRRAAQEFDFIARAEFAGFLDGEIKTRSSAFCKAFDNVIAPETNAELKARLARLRDDEFRRPDAKAVADVHVRFN